MRQGSGRLAALGLDQAAVDQHFRDLHGVGGGTFTQVVGYYPHIEGVGLGFVAAQAAHQHGVAAVAVFGHGVAVLAGLVDQLHTVAGALLEFETLTGDEIKQLIAGEDLDRPDPGAKASLVPKAGTSIPKTRRPNGPFGTPTPLGA